MKPILILIGFVVLTSARTFADVANPAKPPITESAEATQDGSPEPPRNPSASEIIKDACPFECCGFGEWKMNNETPVPIVEAPNGKNVIGKIRPDETVTAITGEQHIIPLKLTVTVNHKESGFDFKKGDILFLRGHQAECGIEFYRNGNHGDDCLSDVLPGELQKTCRSKGTSKDCWAKIEGNLDARDVWWVKVKTKAGVTGWVNATLASFDGNDSCS